MDDETRTNQDDEPDITNALVAASDAADDSDATPDDAAATPLGAAGAVIRALAADDTDNDG
ncbi:MAG: hypothetical protein M3Y74_00090 [Chloroflexota bacterium]|jgi:hypothetical protein|nr:hypothetical protein [Chloroflexota bacterium]